MTFSTLKTGGPDTLQLTNPALYGDAPTMSGNADGGNDILTGGATNDFLYGDAKVYNPATPGSITGGRDILNGGTGNDELSGGGNSDTFVFNTGSGNDLITDFDQGNKAVGSTATEHDLINVGDYGFADWTALSSLISDDTAGDAVIHLSASDTITLDGVHAASLHPTDFLI
ncbi:Ca2+-binding RTX toxin-like protein [Bradyrhizobium sp. LM4.3]